MDERLKNAFLELLRSGIWGTWPNAAYFSDFSEADWYALHAIACKQTVIAVCLQAVYKLPESCRPPSSLLLTWIGQGRYIEVKNCKIIEVWTELNEKLSSEGIYPMILKGLSFANNYANPFTRQASDLDLYVSEGYNKVVKIVEQWGCTVHYGRQHDSFDYNGVHIELHPRITTLPFDFSLECNPVESTYFSTKIRVPNIDLRAMILLSHAAGHYIIEGISYRFLCDWATFLKSHHDQINSQTILEEAKKIGMLRFLRTFTQATCQELHVNFKGIEKWTKHCKKEDVSQLITDLIWSGDFGSVNYRKNFVDSFHKKIIFLVRILNHYKFWPALFWRKMPLYLFKLLIKQLKK